MHFFDNSSGVFCDDNSRYNFKLIGGCVKGNIEVKLDLLTYDFRVYEGELLLDVHPWNVSLSELNNYYSAEDATCIIEEIDDIRRKEYLFEEINGIKDIYVKVGEKSPFITNIGNRRSFDKKNNRFFQKEKEILQ